MWKNSRFVAMSDPQKGGLYIAAAKELSENIQNEIIENLELVVRDKEHLCTAIYPLSSGEYVIAVAKKVQGTSQEPREHEVIRGVVIAENELGAFCQEYMSEEYMKKIFFPENTDLDHLEDWRLPVIKTENVTSKDLIDQIEEGRRLLGLFHALKETAESHLKIQLIVEDGAKLKTMAFLGCLQSIAGTRLFMTVEGECTLKAPDILILDQAVYQDTTKYYKMDLEKFIHMGNDFIKHAGVPAVQVESEDERIEKLLDFCFDYLTYDYLSEYEIYQVLGNVKKTDACLYTRFLRCLRKKLFAFPHAETKRYMTLLYIVFKKKTEEKSVELETAPYDFQEMCLFLSKKARNKREQKKLIMMMLELQFQKCMEKLDERMTHEAARNIVELH